MRINELRKEPLEDLARKVGVSYATMWNWANGRSQPRADKAKKLAEALNTTVEYLIDEKEAKKNALDDTGMDQNQPARRPGLDGPA